MADQDRAAMLQKLREKLLSRKGGSKRDPDEWKPPQVNQNEEIKVKAFILPPLEKGEPCSSGKAAIGMGGLFFMQVGDHWINKKRFPCPRLYDNDECPYCQLGFNLLSETQDKKARSEISKTYLPRSQYAVNMWFPDIKSNPDELRGQVKFVALPKTIYDKLEECIQRDDAGDDEDDPKPWGIFYDPMDAYPLNVVINKKGEYNNYTDSKLLANARGRIAATSKEVNEILSRRHDIPSKYPERTAENLRELKEHVEALLNGSSGDSSSSSQSNNSSSSQSSGFDADEVSRPKASKVSSVSSDDDDDDAVVKPKTSRVSPVGDDDDDVRFGAKEKVRSKDLSAIDDPDLQALLDSMKAVD